jgi:hypothetical protein
MGSSFIVRRETMSKKSGIAGLGSMLLTAALAAGCVVHEVPYTPPPSPPPAEPGAPPAPPPPPAAAAPAAPPAAPAPAPAAPPPAAPPAPAATAQHPAYLHALTDLRVARAHLERRGGDRRLKWDEHDAIVEIDRAIELIKAAAIDDGKPIDDHPPIDVRLPRGGRLRKASTALRAARADIMKEEDNAFANGLRNKALQNIDEAIRFTEAGILEAERAS